MKYDARLLTLLTLIWHRYTSSIIILFYEKTINRTGQILLSRYTSWNPLKALDYII